MFSGLLDDPKVGRLLDLPPAGPEGLGNICERCIGLDLPFGGLPEAQIMHELPSAIAELKLVWWPWPWWCSSWSSQGPRNVNGRIKSLAIHPSDGDVVYTEQAADGGVWKTTNAGSSWYATMSLELAMSIGALAIAPRQRPTRCTPPRASTPGLGSLVPGCRRVQDRRRRRQLGSHRPVAEHSVQA